MTQPMLPQPNSFGQYDDLEPVTFVSPTSDARALIDAKVDAVTALVEAAGKRYSGEQITAQQLMAFLETWRDAMTSL